MLSAAQISVSACWASWADCLPVLRQYLPHAAQACPRDLEAPVPQVPCLRCCHSSHRAQSCGLDSPQLARAGASSVPARRRRPRERTGPPPLLADGKGLRPRPLPAARAHGCSPFWTHPARLCSPPWRTPYRECRVLPGRGWTPLSSPLSLRALFLPCKGFLASCCQERAEHGRSMSSGRGPLRCALRSFSCCCPGCCSHAAPFGAREARRNSCSASRTSTPAAERARFNLACAPRSCPRRRSCVRVRAPKSGRATCPARGGHSLQPRWPRAMKATLAALSDPDRRPPQPRRPLPPPRSLPAAAIRLDAAAVADALRTAKKGTAAGLSGATVDHYKVLLADEATLALFSAAATKLANADVPEPILAALALARLTALQKPSGGVRGIATGDTFRRLVARTLYARRFDEATRPYQFALQARAGTDCLAALLRAATELDPAATVVSLDGRCAYDSVSRAAFLDKLAEVTPSLVPFVRAFYARQSVYLWWDGAGACHRILQGDGCEQGDALAPCLPLRSTRRWWRLPSSSGRESFSLLSWTTCISSPCPIARAPHSKRFLLP